MKSRFQRDFIQGAIMKTYARTTKNVSGFTMLDIMCAIAIMGILAAIAVPTILDWVPDHRLRAEARTLYSNLQRAKMGAIRSNQQWRVFFNSAVSPGQYFLCSGPGVNNVWDGPAAMGGDDVVVMAVNLSGLHGVDYGNGTAGQQIAGFGAGDAFGPAIDYAALATAFTARGTVNLLGYVYLTNSKGTCYAVGTPSPAGLISLRRWGGNAWQ